MNRYFRYPHMELWKESVWEDKISQVFGLVKWMGRNEAIQPGAYPKPVDGLYGQDCQNLACYHPKTNSVNPPEVVEGWRQRGVHYEVRAQGGVCWLIMAPLTCLEDFGAKLPTLVVMHQEDISDPYWAMKTLDRFSSYNEMVARDQDCIVVYIVAGAPDDNRIYINILQEAFVFVPGDVERVWLDVSLLDQTGTSLREIPDFVYRDRQGNPVADPDAAIRPFGAAGVPVLDITGRWENKCSLSRDQISKENWSSRSFSLDRVVHSESGRKIAQGMVLEYNHDTVYEPAFLAYWERMGLRYVSHETKLRRWKAAVPMQALEEPEHKLPCILVMQEVNHANEHLAVTETSYFYEYFRIAAQGQCILVSFVLEDAQGNELLEEILDEAQALYPIDPSRVYIAGHSHNGHYALEFATRHPRRIAAVATYGDPPGLVENGMIPLTPEKLEAMKAVDLPLINLAGCAEAGRLYPLNQDGYDYRPWHGGGPLVSFAQRARSWQLRLEAWNCSVRSPEEIAATKNSPDKAERELGIPADKCETLWLDGFELYIVDIKNKQGKFHLRMVGEENMPHNTTPAQQAVSWSFLRRFARDQKTGEIIELC